MYLFCRLYFGKLFDCCERYVDWKHYVILCIPFVLTDSFVVETAVWNFVCVDFVLLFNLKRTGYK